MAMRSSVRDTGSGKNRAGPTDVVDYGECPYLPGRTWTVEERRDLDAESYEAALARGWRRAGEVFYRTVCTGCAACLPIRIDVRTWTPSRSQRRAAAVNSDIAVSIVPGTFSMERYRLYLRYLRGQHGLAVSDSPRMRAVYAASYLRPLAAAGMGAGAADHAGEVAPAGIPGTVGGGNRSAISEYRNARDGALVAAGYLDLLPDGYSSVYFTFDPLHARRSLGVWSVGRELRSAGEAGLRHYYLGFWIPGSPKMDYKADFRPFELAIDGTWLPFADRRQALRELSGRL